MAIGDKSAQSYGWPYTLKEAVPDGGSVVVPAPGLDLTYTDTEHADVTVASNGAVWRTGKGKVEVVFEMNEDDPRATVANTSGAEWPVGDQLYLFCPHLLAEGANEWDLKGQIWDLQQRVSALEGDSEASKSEKSPPKPVVEPPKAPPAPHRANVPPSKPPNSPQRAPTTPQGGPIRR